jgi:phosphoenolpyruvate-protein kinase (PTS system EI component)
VDELSAAPSLVPSLKFLIRRLKVTEARDLAAFAIECESAAEILAHCQELTWGIAPNLFESK